MYASKGDFREVRAYMCFLERTVAELLIIMDINTAHKGRREAIDRLIIDDMKPTPLLPTIRVRQLPATL